jgi:glutathione S-transferase
VLPPFIINRINTTMTRRGARHITPHSLAERYDAAHEQLLKILGTVQENEWTKGASFFGEHLTIADIFHGPTRHFNEHAAIVRQTLQAR